MIDKNKLIEELNKMGQEVERHLKSAEKEGNVMFAFSIKNQLAMLRNVLNRVKHQSKMEKWIPCSERLPENISTVIVQVKEIEKPTFGWYMDIENSWILSERDFVDLKEFTVLAWQPLPESYQPKGEE